MTIEEILSDPCPECGTVGHLHHVVRDETVAVRGRAFLVQAQFFTCDVCKTEFEQGDGPDVLDQAYRQYRDAVGLLQPEQLRTWRKSLELKQSHLAALLGWSMGTVSRYENGALQDEAHDRALRAAMTPNGLAALVASANDLPAKVRERLQKCVDEQLASVTQLSNVVARRLARGTCAALNWPKLVNTVLFFCQGSGVTRTKLNKLLFYADFLHYKYFEFPITGLNYVRLPHGPVPDGYELLFSAMSEEGLLVIIEEEVGEHTAYIHRACQGASTARFSTSEMQALVKVLSEFERATAKTISERSHSEDAWTKTSESGQVSLSHAKALSLTL